MNFQWSSVSKRIENQTRSFGNIKKLVQNLKFQFHGSLNNFFLNFQIKYQITIIISLIFNWVMILWIQQFLELRDLHEYCINVIKVLMKNYLIIYFCKFHQIWIKNPFALFCQICPPQFNFCQSGQPLGKWQFIMFVYFLLFFFFIQKNNFTNLVWESKNKEAGNETITFYNILLEFHFYYQLQLKSFAQI